MGGPAGGGVRTAPGLAGRRGSGAGRSGFTSQLWPASCVTIASSLLNPGPGAPAACVGHSPESHRPHRVRGAARSPAVRVRSADAALSSAGAVRSSDP